MSGTGRGRRRGSDRVLGDDPLRYLVVGPDRSGNLLELAVIQTAERIELVIHAMALRRSTERELFGREQR